MWKFKWKKDKDKFLILLLVGLLLLIVSWPQGKRGADEPQNEQNGMGTVAEAKTGSVESTVDSEREGYERRLEQRLKELLEQMEGVGAVEVMLVLHSSEEKVWHVDRQSSSSLVQESAADGSGKSTQNQEENQETVLIGSGQEATPMLEKEIYPQIEGIVILAEGAGDASVRAEITEAVEALFGLSVHKIKVSKKN